VPSTFTIDINHPELPAQENEENDARFRSRRAHDVRAPPQRIVVARLPSVSLTSSPVPLS
jgi:hypothetical protein